MIGIFDMSDPNSPLPENAYFDTNTLLDTVWTNRPYYGSVTAFSARLGNSGVPIVMTGHAAYELQHAVLGEVYKAHAAPGQRWTDLFRVDKSHVPGAMAEVQRILDLFNLDPGVINVEFTNDDTLISDLLLYCAMGMDSGDAMHLAIAKQIGTNDIVTNDAGFIYAEDINIWTANRKILQAKRTLGTRLSSTPIPFPHRPQTGTVS